MNANLIHSLDSNRNNVNKFLEWLQVDIKTNRNPINIHDFANTGRGMIATRDIQSKDIIISIPSHFFIDTSVIAKSDLMNIFNSSQEKPTPTEALLLFILWEKFKGISSKWYHYINVLPKSFNLPLFWPQEYVLGLPKKLQKNVNIQKTKVQKSYDKIKKILDFYFARNYKQSQEFCDVHEYENPTTTCKPFTSEEENQSHITELSKNVVLNDRFEEDYIEVFNPDFIEFCWAWTVVNSRGAFKDERLKDWLSPHEKDNVVLVPLLDMFNHSATAQVEAGFDEKEGCYVIKSLCPYKKGCQVFINYGPHDNHNLLLDYGFICEDNVHDCVYLCLSDLVFEAEKCGVEKIEEKVEIIKAHQFDKHFFFSLDSLSWNLTQSLLVLSEDCKNTSSSLQYWGTCSDFNALARRLVAGILNRCLDEIPNMSFSNEHENENKPYLNLAKEICDLTRCMMESVKISLTKDENTLI